MAKLNTVKGEMSQLQYILTSLGINKLRKLELNTFIQKIALLTGQDMKNKEGLVVLS